MAPDGQTEFTRWVFANFANIQSLAAYLFVAVLSFFSGAVGHFYRRNSRPPEDKSAFSWPLFSYDQAASLLVAIILFWATLNRNFPPFATAVGIAVVAFWGTQSLIYVLRIFQRKLKNLAEELLTDPPKKPPEGH